MSDIRFTDDDMRGFAYQAYCAGWKAALNAMQNPSKLADNHARDWFDRNQPSQIAAPVWRIPTPPKDTGQ